MPWDKYQWKRLPLGLLGAPFIFSKAMARIFLKLPFVVVYFDNILIFSNTIEEHRNHLQQVFDLLLRFTHQRK